MLPPLDDTIAAVATASGGASRGIVRLSGPRAVEVTAQVFVADEDRHLADVKSPCVCPGAVTIELHDRPSLIPCQVYLWPTRRSYTRQPTAEFHTLGSPPILHALLRALCENGARVAQPGEFTLRAFLAGRLDLTQ